MSAIEKSFQTCLPPEAYIRIAQSCNNEAPRFATSYYPKKQPKKDQNETRVPRLRK